MKHILPLLTVLGLALLGTGQAQKWKLFDGHPDTPSLVLAYSDGGTKAYAQWQGYKGQLGSQILQVNSIQRSKGRLQGMCRTYTYLGKLNNSYALKTSLYDVRLSSNHPAFLNSYMPTEQYSFTASEAHASGQLCEAGQLKDTSTVYIPSDAPYFEVAGPGEGLAFEIKLDLFNNIILKLL